MTSPEEWNALKTDPDGFFVRVYGEDAAIGYNRDGKTFQLNLGQALAMERAMRRPDATDDPLHRAYVHAQSLSAAGTLLPEHMDILELEFPDGLTVSSGEQ